MCFLTFSHPDGPHVAGIYFHEDNARTLQLDPLYSVDRQWSSAPPGVGPCWLFGFRASGHPRPVHPVTRLQLGWVGWNRVGCLICSKYSKHELPGIIFGMNFKSWRYDSSFSTRTVFVSHTLGSNAMRPVEVQWVLFEISCMYLIFECERQNPRDRSTENALFLDESYLLKNTAWYQFASGCQWKVQIDSNPVHNKRGGCFGGGRSCSRPPSFLKFSTRWGNVLTEIELFNCTSDSL